MRASKRVSMRDIAKQGNQVGRTGVNRPDTERAWLEVDLAAFRRNAQAVADRVGGAAHLLPMVKADGYGLGAVSVTEALGGLGVWAFGVATVGEGAELRQAGIRERIVVFTPCAPIDGPNFLELELEAAVTSLAALRSYAEVATGDQTLPVHLEVDTGMGRFGLSAFEVGDWAPRVAELLSSGSLQLVSTYTHFHSAGRNARATRAQWAYFLTAVDELRAAGVEPGLLHAANSDATLRHPNTHGDIVRPGLFLYGGYGGGDWGEGRGGAVEDFRPEPVVRVQARVLDVREVPEGTTVSYGATFTTVRSSRLATLGIGYADGMPHALSNRGHVIVAGRRVPVLGAVCMDMTVVDVTEIRDVKPGAVATVLGRAGAEEISLEEVARSSGTIEHEILTGFSSRLPRVVVSDLRRTEQPPARKKTGQQLSARTLVRHGL